ncbi:MAG: hypothetical protein F4060_06545 [Holophagales bacterium]|nr:hypothetical protein [Holophagales bacterium]MYG31738.1 hypothetical protein [Holophagales bacterium]MYI79580.1 hypothetical protein [Holophagales bacterium]
MRRRLASGIELRNASSDADYAAVVELQQQTWGDSFDDAVPPPMLKISQKMGGVVAGAYDGAGRMLGFIYGMSGFRFGERAHWSHMLAVTRDARGLGLGRELKAFQRELLLELEVETVYWTYDPLVARNANLNLNRLGALPVEYVEDMYGEDTGSILHSGLGTDRFIVAWPIGSERVAGLMEGGPTAGPTRDMPPFPVDETLVNTAWVEVPPNIGSILRSAPEDAAAWRQRTRGQFQEHLGDGYEVTGFTWRERAEPDAGQEAGAPSVLNRRYYYRLEKLEGAETR